MGIHFEMISDFPRNMVRRITIPTFEGKSDDDFVELMDMWEDLKHE